MCRLISDWLKRSFLCFLCFNASLLLHKANTDVMLTWVRPCVSLLYRVEGSHKHRNINPARAQRKGNTQALLKCDYTEDSGRALKRKHAHQLAHNLPGASQSCP